MAACKYCLNEITDGAKICEHCGSRQNVALNRLTFVSGLVGLITLIASGIVFLTSSFSAWHIRQYGADIQVLNFSSLEQSTILNDSSEPVVLKTLRLNFAGNRELEVIFDEVIAPGQIRKFYIGRMIAEQTTSPLGAYFSPRNVGKLDTFPMGDTRHNALSAAFEKGDFTSHTAEFVNIGGSSHMFFFDPKRKRLPIKVGCRLSLSYQVVGGKNFDMKPPVECTGMLRLNLLEREWLKDRQSIADAILNAPEPISYGDLIRIHDAANAPPSGE